MTRGEAGWGRLRHRVISAIRDRGLWRPGDRVAVAVSGGRDSTVLLDLLAATRRAHGAILSVVTVDHGTRPGSADDAAAVVQQAEALGLPVVVSTHALGASASEADCRDLRYAVFDGLDVDRVALGHHRRDQAETLLLAAVRGGGSRGLAGMPWTDGRHARPLLDVEDAAIAAWAVGRGLGWREDPSNADPRFLRGRVRRELLPLLEALRPGAEAVLARAAGHLGEDDALLAQLSVAGDTTDLLDGAWAAIAPAPLVRRAILRRWPSMNAAQVDALLVAVRAGVGGVQLSRDVALVVEAGAVRTVRRDPPRDDGG